MSETTTQANADQATLSEDERKIRDHFLGWQCRLRQHSIRHMHGQPSAGLQPHILIGDTDQGFENVTVLLVRRDSAQITAEWRHMVKRTSDPKLRYDSALKQLAEMYYQHPKEFMDAPTALFAPGSNAAARLEEVGRATLAFNEKSQRYMIPCAVRRLSEDDPVWQATYWHNHLFNPVIPGDSPIVQFVPDWLNAKAEPPVY